MAMREQIWIKSVLKAEGHKLKDVAAALGITSPRVTDIIQGKREVQSDELVPLAKLLGLGVQSLLASLEKGERTLIAGDGPSAKLPVLGYLTGNGDILSPQSDENGRVAEVSLPTEATNSDGLYCYIMGDNSMAGEIKAGDILIAADPRKHFYPMTPGGLFLLRLDEQRLVLRQYIRSEKGEGWMVALPAQPDPALQNWRFDMLPADLQEDRIKHGTGNGQSSDQPTLGTADIFAAVLWVHRRYIPE